jgi:hypothetical protein
MERHTSRVTAVSWIPSEAVTGAANKSIFATVAHYDDPPPDRIDGGDTGAQGETLEAWRSADRFRFANQLSAWIEADDRGSIVAAGYDGQCRIGSTTLGVGSQQVEFQAVALDVKQSEPEIGEGWARFTQSYGGRTGVPGPRRVSRPPFVQFWAPLVWTTLALTLYDDGSAEHELVGASPFPRHWMYDADGELVAKSGTTNFKNWYRRVLPRFTPWGDTDSPALVTAVETAVERELSAKIMRAGRSPKIRKVRSGTTIIRQGEPGEEVMLILDGVVSVDVDGTALAELGPGAVLGERAVVEACARTSTVTAVTDCRIAVASHEELDPASLDRLRQTHRRETTTN